MSMADAGKNGETGRLYRVVLNESLEGSLLPWFEGLTIQTIGATTVLTGKMQDQSELHGLLRKIHDLHLTLLSVQVIPDPS